MKTKIIAWFFLLAIGGGVPALLSQIFKLNTSDAGILGLSFGITWGVLYTLKFHKYMFE